MEAKRTTVDISSKTIFRVILFGLGVWFLWFIRDIILLLLVAILIASALEPVAARLQKYKVPRGISVILVYLLFLFIVGAAASLFIPVLVEEVQALARELPQRYDQLREILGGAGILLGTPEVISSLQKGLVDIGNFLARASGDIFATTRSVFGGIFAVLLVFVISFYLVLARNGLKVFAGSVVPEEYRQKTFKLVERGQNKIGRWVIAQLVLGVVIGLLTFAGLWALDIPHAPLLALLAGLLEFIPVLGPIIAAVPAVFIGFTKSIPVGILVLILYVVIQQLENHLLVPSIMRRAIGLNPLTTIIAIMIGAKMAGFLGIILAVPVATLVSVIFDELMSPDRYSEDLPG